MHANGWKLLDRNLDAQTIDEATRHVAQKKLVERHGTQAVVIFRIGAEWLALPATAFDEIIERRSIHRLPHRSNNLVLGLTNVRGELLVCISLAHLLGIDGDKAAKSGKHNARERLVVLRHGGSRLVFPTDDVCGTHFFHPDDTAEVPATIARADTDYLKVMLPWEEKMVGLVDDALLFHTLNRGLG